MKLETSNFGVIPDPTPAQIAAALVTLPGGHESFAILSVADEVYVQAAGSDSGGFSLEYRDGSEDRHFQAKFSPVPLSTVQDMFERYAGGDDSWRSRVDWEPWGTRPGANGTVSGPEGGWTSKLTVTAAILVAVAAAILLLRA